jgi:hypothetical protein
MEEYKDSQLKMNSMSKKKKDSPPPGEVYDWVQKVVAEDDLNDSQQENRMVAAADAILFVKNNLENIKTLTTNQIKDDIVRMLVVSIYYPSSAEFATLVSDYLTNALVLTSNRSINGLVYMAMATMNCRVPEDIESGFYDTIYQDIDACNAHSLRWISNTTAAIPSAIVRRMISSLHNLLFRSVASVSVLEKAATCLLNLMRNHAGVVSLDTEINRYFYILSPS